MEAETSEKNKKPNEKIIVFSAGGGDDDDDDDTSSVGIPTHEGGQRVSHWTTLARLHRLHLLVSAASGVPYDRKLLERHRKPEVGASSSYNRKSVTIGGGGEEGGDDCRIDIEGRSRGLSISAPFPYHDNNNDDGDDDDDEDGDGEGSETAASSRPYIKSAIPYLPRRVAVLCLVLNIAVPGTGTMLSGLCAVCCGTPRLKAKEGLYAETVCVNLLVGVMQTFTVTFLLVGWIWSFVWGIYMVLLAVEQNRRLKAKHKKELKVKAFTALNGRLRAWTLQGNREN